MIPDTEILKYYPLIKSIAAYFCKRNPYLDFDDVCQDAWVGFLQGLKRYDPTKRVTIGAALRTWAWGRAYRSILGSKNLVMMRNMNQHPLLESVPENSDPFHDVEFNDFVESIFSEKEVAIIRLLIGGQTKYQIMKDLAITGEEYELITTYIRAVSFK